MIDMIPQTAKEMIQEAAVYVPFNCEGIRIDYCEDDAFYGTGEETGESYKVTYEEVDLDKDLIYKFVLMNG
jgi:hypothetical protein